jgi:hypothetical protein
LFTAAQELLGCALKLLCTIFKQRLLTRHFHEDALQRVNARNKGDPDLMRQRRCAAGCNLLSLSFPHGPSAALFLLAEQPSKILMVDCEERTHGHENDRLGG